VFLVDKPFISDFLRNTIIEHNIPVIKTPNSLEMGMGDTPNLIEEHDAVTHLKKHKNPLIYSNSENAIGWLAKQTPLSTLLEKIQLFKNKIQFRQLISDIYPDFYFKAVAYDELSSINFDELPIPCILKPATGFFSMGVYKITNKEDWNNCLGKIEHEINSVKGLYPNEVLDINIFIIEECIIGDEFAMDVSFSAEGEANILSILQHYFSSERDVSDRLYISSHQIIMDNLTEFTRLAQSIGDKADLRRFPVHIELIKTNKGILVPVEVNAMRFGGWCTSADLTALAYNFNPYVMFYKEQKAEWDKILSDQNDKLYSMIILDNSSGIETNKIRSFDYDKLAKPLENVLEMRKLDFHTYPVFGFLFTETSPHNFQEVKNILQSDLKEYIQLY